MEKIQVDKKEIAAIVRGGIQSEKLLKHQELVVNDDGSLLYLR